MKFKIFLFTLQLAIYVPFLIKAQGNFPFPTGYAQWHHTKVDPVLGPNDAYSISRSFLDGDSIFNGKLYSIVYSQNLCGCICTGNGPFNVANQQKWLTGGVREENGKVYFTRFGKPPFDHYYSPVGDTLLFDFTLETGDTIQYGQYPLSVTETLFNTEGRKIIKLSTFIDTVWWEPPMEVSWTEGIGLTVGLMETFNRLERQVYSSECFTENPLDPCYVPCAVTATNSPELPAQINIYPSFASETVQVELGDGFSAINLRVYSAQGNLLQSHYKEGNKADVNVKNLPAGAYLFVFESREGLNVAKWYLK